MSMTAGGWMRDGETGGWLRFGAPLGVLETRSAGDAVALHGWWALGFIRYEAAPGFDRALRVRGAGAEGGAAALPLVRFTLHEPPEVIAALPEDPSSRAERAAPAADDWVPSITRAEHAAAVHAIRERIARGDTYQVNFTWRMSARVSGDPFPWFRRLARAHAAPHAACIDADRHIVLSASPELFFRRRGEHIVTRPMKGTAPREPSWEEDEAAGRELRASAKNRAENVMIVDMMRNDLGRIARPGSVEVTGLLALERYPTVWQLTSTVEARTGADLAGVMTALFPAASVTGAPKASTMSIIASLESTPRGLYTGAIGWVAPGRRAEFNVAIRTLVIDRGTGTAEYGTGGGVVWDSTAGGEYDEGRAKARFLSVAWPEFALLETLRAGEDGSIVLLDEHLARLLRSARYFGFPADEAAIRESLAQAARRGPARLRLMLHEDGRIAVESHRLEAGTGAGSFTLEPAACSAGSGELLVAPAVTPVSSRDPFLHHKTTHRETYARALRERPGYDEVILWNERGEVTEATASNLVAELDGARLTPPVSSGLLAGTARARLLAEGVILERVITLADLARADAIWLVNSVRGLRRARLAGVPAGVGPED